MAPALRIPVALDLDSLNEQTRKASDRVGETLKLVARQFASVNGEVLGIASATAAGTSLAWSQNLTRTALSFAGWATASVVAVKLVGDVIDSVRQQLVDMVEVFDKARNATVSPEFFQKFTAEADKLKVSSTDLESALTHAFEATKEKSPIDLSKWEVANEQITSVEKTLRVYNATLAQTAGTQLQGLVLFRDADTQEQKVRAILTAMKELNDLGQRAASLNLGDQFFGPQLVNNIRQGKTSAEELLATLQSASCSTRRRNFLLSSEISTRPGIRRRDSPPHRP